MACTHRRTLGTGALVATSLEPAASAVAAPPDAPRRELTLAEHTLEVVSDAGEGAQKCGQIFGAVSAKMRNGVWTVEIIPAEIQPPPRVPEGASGIRIRLGSCENTNWGDQTNLVVAFNEQVLLARHRLGALAEDAVLRAAWSAAMAELSSRKYRIILVPMETQCLSLVDNPRKGKNMFALG